MISEIDLQSLWKELDDYEKELDELIYSSLGKIV
jgi:hypothetical protein